MECFPSLVLGRRDQEENNYLTISLIVLIQLVFIQSLDSVFIKRVRNSNSFRTECFGPYTSDLWPTIFSKVAKVKKHFEGNYFI